MYLLLTKYLEVTDKNNLVFNMEKYRLYGVFLTSDSNHIYCVVNNIV